MSAIREIDQTTENGRRIELYTLDIRPLGGGVEYWTPSSQGGGFSLFFQNKEFKPFDVYSSGFDKNGQGQLPQPKFVVSNVNPHINTLLNTYDDLVGAIVTRIRTEARYLDGEPGSDWGAHEPPDVFKIRQKTGQNKLVVEFKLAAFTDVSNVKIPRRKMFRRYCTHEYRTWNAATNSFDYTRATCPYAQPQFYDEDNNPVASPAQDACSKFLSGCITRYGRSTPLPARLFPGIGKFNSKD